MTVLEVLQASSEFLKKREIDNPRLNAEHLIAHVLQLTRMELYLQFERQLGEPQLDELRSLIRRRGQGEPLQHLLGTVEFSGHIFKSDKRAMVPRPETEELVELLIADCGLRIANGRIMDVGTGSGAIALSLAARFPEAHVVAVDISREALTLARENAAALGLSERVEFLDSDLLEKITESFDLIVANLPYIAMQDRTTLSREVLHDPESALFGGDRGDEIIRRLIEQAPSHLRENGLLALEIGLNQAEELIGFLRQKNYKDIEAKRDYSGIPRFLLARYG